MRLRDVSLGAVRWEHGVAAAVPMTKERRLAALTVDETEIGGEVPRQFFIARASRNFARSRVASPTESDDSQSWKRYEQIFVAHGRVGVVEISQRRSPEGESIGCRKPSYEALTASPVYLEESLPAHW